MLRGMELIVLIIESIWEFVPRRIRPLVFFIWSIACPSLIVLLALVVAQGFIDLAWSVVSSTLLADVPATPPPSLLNLWEISIPG